MISSSNNLFVKTSANKMNSMMDSKNNIILTEFEKFMDQFRININTGIHHSSQKTNSTHTSMGIIKNKRGNFYIPIEFNDEFMYRYREIVVTHQIPLYMTERPLDKNSILKFDFDFLYNVEITEEPIKRLYDIDIIKKIVEITNQCLKEYVQCNKKQLECYVTQRTNPYIKNGNIKDGLHIMYPFIFLPYEFHHYIRYKLIEKLNEYNIYDKIPLKNELKDIVDEAVIERNGWLMYGSTKENVEPYKLTYTFDENCECIDNEQYTMSELIELFSIRKTLQLDQFKNMDWLDFYNEKKPKRKTRTNKKENANINDNFLNENYYNDNESVTGSNYNNGTNIKHINLFHEKYYIEKLVAILSGKRALDFTKWLEVGLCLHNLNKIGDFEDLFICFSMQNFSRIIENLNEIIEKEHDEYRVKLLNENKEIWNTIIIKTSDSIISKQIHEKYIQPLGEEQFYENLRRTWNGFQTKEDGLGIGSLIYWAKNDNPKLFEQIGFDKIKYYIQEAVKAPSHMKFATILYEKNKEQYFCVDFKNKIWYHYNKHYWEQSDGDLQIRNKIDYNQHTDSIVNDVKFLRDKIYREYVENNEEILNFKKILNEIEKEKEAIQKNYDDMKSKFPNITKIDEIEKLLKEKNLSLKTTKIDLDKCRKELLKEFCKPYDETMKLLESSPYKDHIMKEARSLFHDKEFSNKLDANPKLFLFQNGVYDLDKFEFRDGRPEDYISCQGKQSIKYNPFYTIEHPKVQDIENYFKQVLTNDEKRNFFLTLIASCLEGVNTHQIFPILTGSGSNAKSLTMEFIEDTFGIKYFGKISPSFLTQERNKSSSASPEFHASSDKRIISFEEPDQGKELNTAIVKEITGCSKMTSRTLYEAKMTIKTPQFTPVLICNDIPPIKSKDGGTWRRVCVIKFDSKFVDNPQEDQYRYVQNVFKVNRNLKNEMKEWYEPFIWLLINKYYKNYVSNSRKLEQPECIKITTDNYKDDNNSYSKFIRECLIIGCANDKIILSDMYRKFEEWFIANNDDEEENKPKRNEFKKYFESLDQFGKYDSKKGWTGYRFID